MNLNIERVGDSVILRDTDSFDIEQTLECGQCFRFEKIADKQYIIIAFKKRLRIKQNGDVMIFSPCTVEEFKNIWLDYFDLNRDYAQIKNALKANDEVMRRAIDFGGGIRILNQEKIETLISFIISQSKQISGIKKIVRDMSQVYGENLGDGAYAFPTLEVLRTLSASDFADLKTGFRAKYIKDAIEKICANTIDLNPPDEKSTDEIRENLTQIKGVGAKVANCALLFSYARRESFPVDVWVARAVRNLYFGGEDIHLKEIDKWAKEKFGEYGGYAQQYLFYYERSLNGKR